MFLRFRHTDFWRSAFGTLNSFTRQGISMEAKTKGTKGLHVTVSLWCRSCASVLHVSFAMVAFSSYSSDKSQRRATLSPLSARWEMWSAAFAVFSHRIRRNSVKHFWLSEARNLLKSKGKTKGKRPSKSFCQRPHEVLSQPAQIWGVSPFPQPFPWGLSLLLTQSFHHSAWSLWFLFLTFGA